MNTSQQPTAAGRISAQQRLNMVESQIRPSDVTDRRILRAFADVAREQFVPPQFASIAYMDEAVPLGAPGRTLLPPRAFAKLIQLASIEPTDSVLIVGAGRGYSAAIVSKLARAVEALECDDGLTAAAKAALAGHPAVTVTQGTLAGGPAGDTTFDVIIVEGSVSERPESLLARLKPNGRLVAVLTRDRVGTATRWTRAGTSFGETAAFEASAPVLPGFERRASFVL